MFLLSSVLLDKRAREREKEREKERERSEPNKGLCLRGLAPLLASSSLEQASISAWPQIEVLLATPTTARQHGLCSGCAGRGVPRAPWRVRARTHHTYPSHDTRPIGRDGAARARGSRAQHMHRLLRVALVVAAAAAAARAGREPSGHVYREHSLAKPFLSKWHARACGAPAALGGRAAPAGATESLTKQHMCRGAGTLCAASGALHWTSSVLYVA